MKGVADPTAYLARSYGCQALDFAYQAPSHDLLAELKYNPCTLKWWHYGLPKRGYLSDRSAIKYDHEAYLRYIH